MSRLRPLFAVTAVAASLVGVGLTTGIAKPGHRDTSSVAAELRAHSGLPDDFEPAALSAQDGLDRYIVRMDSRAVAGAERAADGELSASQERQAASRAQQSQSAALAEARSLGGNVTFRYDTLVNGFSVAIDAAGAAELAERSDVRKVEPVSIVQRQNESSVPFIGADQVWDTPTTGATRGQGIRVAVVDTGVDYTHANFGGSGVIADYTSNDPTIIEPGTFPTAKVVAGYDVVGETYDVLDDDTTNDTPEPDPDPLDDGTVGDHGSHTAGTCCGIGVSGEIGEGVAPESEIIAIKVWHEGNSTDDVLVEGYERAMDPDDDGDITDGADVISFSGGVDYGTQNSTEAVAAQSVVDLGTSFIASAGNSGNQPVGGSAYITGTPANAPGVVSVAASIDEFQAQTITINSPAITLPDDPIMVQQDWGGDLPSGGLTDDLVDGREFDEPADPGNETPADAQFCDPLPAGTLTGDTVLVFKGSTGEGDCAGSTKVFNAEQAGAQAVIMISLFGGAPSALATNGETITIPAVMISGPNGYAILDELSPDPGTGYNTGTVNATLNDSTAAIPSYVDAMTDFTSEGPARGTSALKPDISAPGFDIQSTDAGTGNLGQKLSGTSMAAPHVSGVAALLTQLHPSWTPADIKAALMNRATQDLKDNLLGEPVSATVIGSGRVQAYESAEADSLAEPSSLSFGLEPATDSNNLVEAFTVKNTDSATHEYEVSGGSARYSDFDLSPANVRVSLDGESFGLNRSFELAAGATQTVHVRLHLDPSTINEDEQLFGWYYFHPNVDGNVTIVEDAGADELHVPWHVAPLAASDNGFSKSALSLGGGADQMQLTGEGAGVSAGDLYLLGATDGADGGGEEDVVAIGARSFAGADTEDGVPQGLPTGTDALVGLTWDEFLADPVPPADPIEFGVQTASVHNTTETLEVDVLVDAGADGVYAGSDEGVDADYMVVKLAASGGEVCVFDLSLADPFDDCTALYFPDYSSYNANAVGLVVDAADIGVTNASPTLAYTVTACTGTFSGDVPGQVCDDAGGKGADGIYEAKLNAANPALAIDPLICGGFWDGGACDGADPVDVSRGSAAAGVDPSILALFPNNAPSATPTVITTDSSTPQPPPDGDTPDTTPPKTKLGKRPKRKIASRKATFRFSSSEPGSSFECKMDRKRFKPCKSPKTYKRLKLGRHVFRVRAIDQAGNRDPTPAKFKFKVVRKR